MTARPDWPSLWDKDPSMKPERMEVVAAVDPSRPDHAPWGKIPPEDYAFVTSALCCDAAIRWLALRAGVLVTGPHACDGEVHVSVTRGDYGRIDVAEATLEGALHTACRFVLLQSAGAV